MTAMGFASSNETAEKKVSFDQIGSGLYAYTAESDPNSGIIIGDDGVMVVDARATPATANEVIARVAKVTDEPIKYVLLTHYHAVETLCTPAFKGAEILASDMTQGLIAECGKGDMKSEIGRFARLFRAAETISGLTWPTITVSDQISIWLGQRKVRIMHIERSAALTTPEMVANSIAFIGDYISTLYRSVTESVTKCRSLKDAFDFARLAMDPKFKTFPLHEQRLPFNFVRAYREARGIERPVIWTVERDREMWAALQG